VSEVARRAGVSVRTVRFYEQKGLLEVLEKTSGGMRLYDERDVTRIKFIRRLRGVGLELEEIKIALTAPSQTAEASKRAKIEHTLSVLRMEASRSRLRILELEREGREREEAISMVSQCLECNLSPCPKECPPQQYVI
jgi:MerR family Zn(II)-responsive transcriptional regulator of zntA